MVTPGGVDATIDVAEHGSINIVRNFGCPANAEEVHLTSEMI